MFFSCVYLDGGREERESEQEGKLDNRGKNQIFTNLKVHDIIVLSLSLSLSPSFLPLSPTSSLCHMFRVLL